MGDSYELRILGVPDLRAPDGRRLTSVLSQPSRLSLLAYLALAPGPVTRAAVVADFWPDSDETRARNALSQAVFYLRRSLDKQTVLTVEGDRLWVPPQRLWCDARELLSGAPPAEDVASAAREGLLPGWNAEASQPLQEWLDGQRRRVRERAEELAPQVEAATPPPPGAEKTASPRTPFPWIRAGIGSALVVLALVVLALVAVVPSWGPTTPRHLTVLLPRVTVPPDTPLDEDRFALTLNAQLIARLPERADVDVVSMPFASSLQSLTRQRTEIFGPAEDLPEWILDVGVGVTRSTVHATAILYRGSDFSAPGRESFDLTLDDPADVAIAAPRAIAERVAEMVDSVLSVNPRTLRP